MQQFSTQLFGRMVNQKTALNNAVDYAIDSAMESITVREDGYSVSVDFDRCIKNFYDALYAAFGSFDNELSMSKLGLYTPVLAIADNDGLYVYYSETIDNEVQKVWSQKLPYSYNGIFTVGTTVGEYVINFSLNDSVTVYATLSGSTGTVEQRVYSGSYNELARKYPAKDRNGSAIRDNQPLHTLLENGPIPDYESFVGLKDEVVTNTIVGQLSYYVNNHNRIAQMYGEQFTFQLPSTARSDVARGIKDVTFMCFFQGYPIGAGSSERYSNFEVSGARIAKKSGYVIQAVDGFLYYHKPSCTHAEGEQRYFESREECAKKGALPCTYCRP